nr:YhjD/YihY/BrkB family envelope integrity protein [Tessaracoccus coleopterorum]
MDRPAVAHALSAYERYSSRLGPQFAAGIAYYSILSMVPILMLCFAALGMTLTIIRPDLMDVVQDQIEALISDVNLSKSISDLITGAMRQWASTLGVGIITGSYAGSRWAGNLKRAVRVMWSREFEDAAERKHFFVELALNLVIFLGLVASVVFSIGVATIGTAFSRTALEFLGWTHIPGIDTLFLLLSIALTLLASWILMAFLFVALPNQPARPWPWLVGTLLGAVALTVLQQLAGLLMGLLGFNSAASVFGPVIVLMIMLYILATTIMLAAAWVGRRPSGARRVSAGSTTARRRPTGRGSRWPHRARTAT